MTTYYIGADMHSNSTELAIEKRNKIVARYSVPTTIPAISNVLDRLRCNRQTSQDSQTPIERLKQKSQHHKTLGPAARHRPLFVQPLYLPSELSKPTASVSSR
ncbi:hypothetical protein ES703_24112 [subsurface metagenome]